MEVHVCAGRGESGDRLRDVREVSRPVDGDENRSSRSAILLRNPGVDDLRLRLEKAAERRDIAGFDGNGYCERARIICAQRGWIGHCVRGRVQLSFGISWKLNRHDAGWLRRLSGVGLLRLMDSKNGPHVQLAALEDGSGRERTIQP